MQHMVANFTHVTAKKLWLALTYWLAAIGLIWLTLFVTTSCVDHSEENFLEGFQSAMIALVNAMTVLLFWIFFILAVQICRLFGLKRPAWRKMLAVTFLLALTLNLILVVIIREHQFSGISKGVIWNGCELIATNVFLH